MFRPDAARTATYMRPGSPRRDLAQAAPDETAILPRNRQNAPGLELALQPLRNGRNGRAGKVGASVALGWRWGLTVSPIPNCARSHAGRLRPEGDLALHDVLADRAALGLLEQPPDLRTHEVELGRLKAFAAEAPHVVGLRLEHHRVLPENLQRYRLEHGAHRLLREGRLEAGDTVKARVKIRDRRAQRGHQKVRIFAELVLDLRHRRQN